MVDGLFIRSLLCSFFFKLFPEIIEAGKLFIAEPPLYRIDDKNNPFVINTEDYNTRYIQKVMKEYKVGGYQDSDMINVPLEHREIIFLDKKNLNKFLQDTTSYVDDITMLSKHYSVNDRLIEMVLEEFSSIAYNSNISTIDDQSIRIQKMMENINIDRMIKRIGEEFPELYYDDNGKIIKGVIDAKPQGLEITERLVRKSITLIDNIYHFGAPLGSRMILKNIKTGTEQELSMLGVLKILKKFQPDILHRFKGLGENNDEDIKQTIMDPNTRCLIRLQIADIENDMKIFQILRGQSPFDSQSRKLMMKNYKIPKYLIDT